MRNFFTSLFGSLAALIIFTMGLCFLGLVLAIGIAAASKKEKVSDLEEGSYLVYKLDANLADTPPGVDLASILANDGQQLQLRQVVLALKAAAKDSRIAGVFVTGSFNPSGYGTSFAALKELRAALKEVRAAGKPVQAYLTDVNTRDYYVASVASELNIDPFGMIVMPGLAARPMFYAGAFEKFGVNVQVTRVGKYKSAVEPYVRKDLSPENREQLTTLLGDLWHDMLADIASTRGLKVEDVQKIVDKDPLIRPDAAKNAKLVDQVLYRDQVIEELKKRTGRVGSKESFKQVSLEEYIKVAKYPTLNVDDLGKKAKGTVALVFAEGEIVDGEGETGQIGGVRFARELRRLRQDESIKAVVLRVNSPGGSASASENILREVALLRKQKPVIVSMGGYAASGGYWISAGATRIFAEPTTITGSIGVFGLSMDVEKLANSVGLTFDTVKTGEHADMFSATRPKTESELAIIQNMVDWTYDEFIRRVSEYRNIAPEKVREIAQGRVWSGTTALSINLVDEIGGLEQAIAYAGAKAGLGEHPRVSEFPRRKELAEALGEFFEKIQPGAKAQGPASVIVKRVERELSQVRALNDPKGIYARMPLNLDVQ